MFNETLTTAAIDVDLPHYGTAEYPQTPQEMDTCWPADVMLQRRHAGQRNVLVHRAGRPGSRPRERQ